MRILIPTQKAISTASSITINIKYLLHAHDSRKAVLLAGDTPHHCQIAKHQAAVSLTQPTLHPLKSLPGQDAACLGPPHLAAFLATYNRVFEPSGVFR
jgi:hypothetical protein